MPRRLAALGALLAATLAAIAALPASAPSAAAEVADRGASPSIELVAQTTVASAGRPFVITVRLDGVPAGGTVTLSVHQRVRSRSELALSMEGDELRSVLFGPLVVPLSDLPAQPDGTRRLVLPIDQPGGLPLPTEGVYPVELTAQDAAGAPLSTLVTHLIVPPEEGDDAPNLAVALVAELEAPLALQPDGTALLDRTDVEELGALVTGLTAVPNVPVSISARPETIEALLASEEAGDAELVGAMQGAAAGRTVLAKTYVPVDFDALASADLLSEVEPQLARGGRVLVDELGAQPDGTIAIAEPTLGTEGLSVVAYLGTKRVVVDDENLEPLADGIISYSLAQPFLVAVPDGAEAPDETPGEVLGMAPDPVVMERLGADDSPGLVVSRVLAELALIRLEQPSVARASVLRLAPGLDHATVEQLVRAIGTGRPFEASTLGGAFDHAEPVVDGGGNVVERSLEPATAESISAGAARTTTRRRGDLETFTNLVGAESSLPDLPSRHLLLATAAGMEDADRRAHLDAAAAAMADVAGQVTTPPTFTLTLTAREGTIPLTIRNDSGVPLKVRVRLSSQKLEFPDGDTIPLVLEEVTTRIDIRVRSRATGAFPLFIDVRTPDGRTSLSTSRYTVRSTAVSGVGLLLSVGAGVFLTVWWARHWRRTRRSQKLIDGPRHAATGDLE